MVLQRVSRARVRVGDEEVGAIAAGVVVLVGVIEGDDGKTVGRAVKKLAEMRIFSDERERMNRDAAQAGAAFLVVSQFTLAGRLEKGRRPSFTQSASPDVARQLVADLAEGLRARGYEVGEGRFGASMQVELTNDGPVTFVLDF